MASKTERIDILLVKQGKVPSREKARQLIMAGEVLINDQIVDKPSKLVPSDSIITLRNNCGYVSRGGYKLEKALKFFEIDVEGKIAIDVGASTGGFTDCLLRNGASLVYAVDVGYGQLDWALRNDKRVKVLERTNIRYVDLAYFDREIDLAVIDVSFISLDKVIPIVASIITDDADIIALIKPQFEAEKGLVGKGGVVRDPDVHVDVIRNVCEMALKNDFGINGVTHSPIKGPSGNIEYLIWLKKMRDQGGNLSDGAISKIVADAYSELSK